ncbi:MAG TPA: pro-sigmaK processing inhibitor BofA family protein [Methanoregula sp.]|nr:pro-sigmaK processing inhibitor BofA family protein [Methanoregula sp.]
MSDVLIAVLLVVAIVAVVYYLVKELSVVIANAVVGLILLVVLNYLHVMQWMGKPDLGYDLATVLVCAVGGVPGVCILVLLNILGVTI